MIKIHLPHSVEDTVVHCNMLKLAFLLLHLHKSAKSKGKQ